MTGTIETQLARTLQWAARSPFYRRRFGDRVPDDLTAVPLTTKQDLRDSYPFGMLAVDRRELATYHESSGTAGAPTASYYTAEDWTDLVDRYARKWVGITADDTFLVRTPYALMITGHLAHAAARRHGATVVPGDNRSLAMPYSRVVRILHDLDVTLTWSLPAETLLWAASARLAGYRPGHDFPALRALFVGGEPLSDARRKRIADIWGVPVVEEYGSTETGSLAGQCRLGRLHLWADRVIFEVYEPESGAMSRDGRGQLVVTPLRRRAMPLLRYNTGDAVDVSYEPCACGSEWPTVRVLGRAGSAYRVKGVPISQGRLEDLVYGLPAELGVLFWRARADPAGLRLQVEAPPEHRATVGDELTTTAKGLGIDAEVQVLEPGGLVPHDVLTRAHDVVKPRCLFGPAESWDGAWLYY